MMIGRLDRKARPVLREENDVEAPLWRMVCPDFEGKVHIVKCGAGEEGWNHTIIGNFQMPVEAALNAVLPGGKGHLGALREPAATGVPKETVLKFSDKRQRKKKTHEAISVPSLVPEVLLRVRVDRLRVLSLLMIRKRKVAASVAGGEKVPKFRKNRATAVPKPQTAVPTEPREEPVSVVVTPPSSPKGVEVETQKKGEESPSIEVVSGGSTPPSVHAEETSKKTAGEMIVDTLDSSNNLIDPHEDGGKGVRSQSPLKKLLGPLLRVKGLGIKLQFSRGRVNWSIIIVLIPKSGVLISTAPLEYLAGG
ncbi:hypothetical protein HanPI659440_Chr13g0506501 [Helianthus annuus]|nr:hypothetical protein HanPI659440_Chr13g0506501 [Helianthus annuus]